MSVRQGRWCGKGSIYFGAMSSDVGMAMLWVYMQESSDDMVDE